jgi:hypothetical protein
MLDGESLFFSPPEPTPSCSLPLAPKKNVGGEILVQVCGVPCGAR